jgi:hypothetical protein
MNSRRIRVIAMPLTRSVTGRRSQVMCQPRIQCCQSVRWLSLDGPMTDRESDSALAPSPRQLLPFQQPLRRRDGRRADPTFACCNAGPVRPPLTLLPNATSILAS